MDDNWVCRDMPEYLLVEGISSTVKTKAQLIGIIEGGQPELAKAIADIELHDGFASVKFLDGRTCYQAACHDQLRPWRVQLDRDQRLFRARLQPAPTPLLETPKTSREQPRPAYTCSRHVPCVMVDYDFLSSRVSSQEVYAIFAAHRVKSVERHSACWHVHFDDEDAVEAVYLDRYEFKYHGRRVRPHIEDGAFLRSIRDRPSLPKADRRESLEDIRNLIMAKSTASRQPVEYKILEPITEASLDAINLPIFNKKTLQRLQEMAEEEGEEEMVVVEEEVVPAICGKADKKRKRVVSVAVPVSQATEVPESEAGCARLLGFVKQRPEDKIVWFEPILDDEPQSGLGKPRSSRANRNLMAELTGKLSGLHLRQKKVVLGRSSIHSYGLFAGEDIDPGDFVIEYVGEVIRHSLANVRERRLEEQLRAAGSTEMASSYFFRLDLTYVVDATHTGNLARFVNHCCDPSCTAKVVHLEGSPHIVFYARRAIARGEEITYDYKFAIEDDPAKKIRCLCGSPSCRRYLN